MPKITLDGLEFNSEDLGAEAQAVLASLRFLDEEMARLRQEIAIYRTARAAYVAVLRGGLGTGGEAGDGSGDGPGDGSGGAA